MKSDRRGSRRKPGCDEFRPNRRWADTCANCQWSRTAHRRDALEAQLYRERAEKLREVIVPSDLRPGEVRLPVRPHFRRYPGDPAGSARRNVRRRDLLGSFFSGLLRGLR